MDTIQYEWKCGYFVYKYQHNALWLLILQHNFSYGVFTQDTAKFSLSLGRFSLLSQISNEKFIKRYNKSYEFLLEYPVEFPNEYNHWIQSKDPMSEWDREEVGLTATGFSPVKLSWSNLFGGLMRNMYKTSLLDGETGYWNWNFAIGDWTSKGGVSPGPLRYFNGSQILVSSIFLWLHIKRPICTYYFCSKQRKTCFPYITVLITCIFFASE